MKKITLICDRCKHEETEVNEHIIKNQGWKEITLSQGYCSSRHELKEYLFCPECCKQFGIAEKKPETEEECNSLADRLIECIVEIVAEHQG